jgi:hypothetical protein
MRETHEIFEDAMDEIEASNPESPILILCATRYEEEDGTCSYPVTAGAKRMDILSGEPEELAEIILSSIRTLKKMCTSILDSESNGRELFDFCVQKCQSMSRLEEDSTVIQEKEWNKPRGGRLEEESIVNKTPLKSVNKIFIEKLKRDWKIGE